MQNVKKQDLKKTGPSKTGQEKKNLISTNFWKEDWTLGYVSPKI